MHQFTVENDEKQTVLTALRKRLPKQPSWSAVRKLMKARRIAIGGVLCLDESRRLSRGESVTVTDKSLAPPPRDGDVKIQFIDKHIVVVEKPSGMLSIRRKSEYAWPWEKRNQQPTLDECVPRIISEYAAKKNKKQRDHRRHPKLFPVHRLDRDSSGLLVFARNEEAQTKIIQQFAQHSAVRKYLALIPGTLDDQTIRSQLIRDRGDGLRGSTEDQTIGEHAITHFILQRKFGEYSELSCKLETGRTNQIRIHLAEAKHPICGDIKYRGPYNSPPVDDNSNVHRLALHATELNFTHPETNDSLEYSAAWPIDMQRFIEQLT